MPRNPVQRDFTAEQPPAQGAVECLGRTFPSDAARREHFLGLLRDRLRDPAFREIEGFPLASDEDILRLSDPPYFTACPNPFLTDFLRVHGTTYDPATDNYHRDPMAVDVSEGRTDPIFTAHAYHTKVPHRAIMRAILHYTDPGDVVLDGFAGSGMTGVAAQMCGCPDPEFKAQLEEEWKNLELFAPRWGTRRAVLNDLGPAATFIAANYNLPFDADAFERESRRILDEVDAELGWMYQTLHNDGKTKGRINYTVWSEVFSCPNCGKEVVFVEEALDADSKRVRDAFPCPSCRVELTKDSMRRRMETLTEPARGTEHHRVTFRPVLINYGNGGARHEKKPDKNDLELLRKIAARPLPATVPVDAFPLDAMYHGSRLGPKGFTHVHHLFLPRTLQSLGSLWEKASRVADVRLRNALLFFVEQALWTASLLNRYRPTGYSQNHQYLTGVYYVASQHSECSPWYVLDGKRERLVQTFRQFQTSGTNAVVSTGSATSLGLPEQSIDYIFTDPPFGENIFYADLNFLVECWHCVRTNSVPEAIIDRPKHKELQHYQDLMTRCFQEYYRVLKPGRWMTVVFHNSRNSVWNAIQQAMGDAGFVVADLRTLDRQQGSYRQVTSTAVKQDLVISAYRPSQALEQRFELSRGSAEGAWAFLREHLQQLPSFVTAAGRPVIVADRQPHLLFDRMVAFHVRRNVEVPISAPDFFTGLDRHFEQVDGMYFLPEQRVEYEARKARTKQEVQQPDLFVSDEASAVQWLRLQLKFKPQTYQELFPQFVIEMRVWDRHEKPLELLDLLKQNFLCCDGKGEVPPQIHAYLSSNYHDLRKLAKDAPELREKARNRWYVPDPANAAQMEKLREEALLREFEEYRTTKQRRLKVFRQEAVRVGFRRAWQDHDYQAIVDVGAKLPESVLEEDEKLSMWHRVARRRLGVDE